jgi:glycosyltransferase involved in cell wall biosynthesis
MTPGVLFIVNSLETGGAEKQVVTLLNHLDTGRFRLHLAYLKRNEKLLPELRHDRLAAVLCCDVARRIDGAAIQRLRKLIVDAGIDAIVCTNPYATLYGRLAVRGSGVRPKRVTVFHTTLLRSLKERAQMLLYRRLFNRSDLLIYVCESQRAHWRAAGIRPARDEVIYNGIDTAHYTESRSSEELLALRRSLGCGDADYLIGLCSVFRPEKAHADLLAAISRLRAQRFPAKGLLIGDGPQRAAIERAASRLGLEQHVVITGLREDVRPFIEACDVMTLVSHSVEAFSLAALESMSLGKPMVMSDVGGATELVTHGEQGFVYRAGDIEALTMHLRTLADGPLRGRLGRAAALRVRERFTVQAMSDRFADCIGGLLDDQRRAVIGREPTLVR